jgi:hypothetical protein
MTLILPDYFSFLSQLSHKGQSQQLVFSPPWVQSHEAPQLHWERLKNILHTAHATAQTSRIVAMMVCNCGFMI